MNERLINLLSFLAVLFLSTSCQKEGGMEDNNSQEATVLGFEVTVHDKEKACQGSTFFVYKQADPDIIYEIDMDGQVLWHLQLSEELGNKQSEAELMADNTILLVSQGTGLFILDRDGNINWEHRDPKISHDADLLSNGNYLYVYGMGDAKTDTTVKEVNSSGQLVWSWRAYDYFNYSPHSDINPQEMEGWAHANAVSRLSNGNTLISIRNFNMIVEINPQGKPVDTILDISSPHDPEMQNNGNILVANQEQSAHSAFDYNPTTNQNDWQYDMITERSEMPMRDVNLLPNGNILITGATKIVEVTRDKEVVWQLELTEAPGISQTSSDGFYKAERLSN